MPEKSELIITETRQNSGEGLLHESTQWLRTPLRQNSWDNNDLASVIVIPIPSHKTCSIEPIDDAGNGARCQAGRLCKPASGHNSFENNNVKTCQVGPVYTQLGRDSLAVQRTQATDFPHGRTDRVDKSLAIFVHS